MNGGIEGLERYIEIKITDILLLECTNEKGTLKITIDKSAFNALFR